MVNVKIKQARNLCITSCFVTGLQGLPLLFPKTALELAWIRRIISDLFLPSLGWMLQRSRAGGTRCSSYVMEYLKASRFDAGEELRRKADPEQVAIDI